MSAESKLGRVLLVPVLLVIAALLGGMFLGRALKATRAAKRVEPSPPKVLALSPDATLPPSTPAFSPAGPNLAGRVVSTHGDPVPGARILIDAARPRTGRGYT